MNHVLLLQLYERRKKHLKDDEKERWASVNANYMTEESQAEDGETVRQHHLTWRSQGTHMYMLL